MRVSSENEHQVFDLQYDALIKEGVDPRHIFQDKVSGAKDNRKGLQEALDYLQDGDCLIVWKLDRLGRSLSHLITLIDGFKQKNIGFKSITEQMDTTTPHGEFLFSVFGALAQYERALTKERIMAGLKSAKQREKQEEDPELSHLKKCKQLVRH
nr:recombinase family protein [Rickettsia endosymbiont of Ixodes pacificus]